MIRRPLASPRPIGAQASSPTSMAPPLRGWNAREGNSEMKPTDAYALINWFPGTANVGIRGGCLTHADDAGTTLKTLMVYSPTDSSDNELFAAGTDGIYDVTTAGTIGSAVTAATNAEWSYVNFTNSAGSFLLAVNGVDDLKLYDGTAWTDVDGVSVPAITGVTTSDLETTCLFKHRVWFTEKGSMNLWYLDVDAISGAATVFPVGGLFHRGGHVVAATNWTLDGGNGMDDYLAIITSEGEVAIYKGTDPSNSSTFALHGVFFAGKPLGNRCFTKYGGDVVILTETGVITMSKLLAGESTFYTSRLTSRIDGAFADAVRRYRNNFGWCCVLHPLQNALIVNVPVSSTASRQFVMNTITGAWCQFTGWDASTFAIFEGELYFTTVDSVVHAWTGPNDFGGDITATVAQAYNYFGNRGVVKQFKLIRPLLEFDNSILLELGIDVDFDERSSYNAVNINRGSTALWDSAYWDNAYWASDIAVEDNWRMVDAKVGYAISLRLRVKTRTSQVYWTATDIIFERGGIFV